MAVDKITPNDSRVKHQYAELAGRRWHYLDAVPQGQQTGTVFLVHGFPDISFAWRYQIPMLLGLGLRCIAIDCMGYGETDAPKVPPASLHEYGFKKHAEAISAIAEQIGADRIILGGHDWGGLVVYRVAQWCPDLVSHVFSVCTPYSGPMDQYISVEQLVKGPLPQFGYQLQMGSEDQVVEKAVHTPEQIRQFLLGIYGGKPKTGKVFMLPEKGVDLSLINDDIGMTPLLNHEELDYYVSQFSRTGIHGACNWYRTRKANHEDEKAMPAEQRKGIKQPTLFIQALNDSVMRPEMSKGMEQAIPHLTRGEVKASHWALWHTPKETNDIIKGWFEGVVFGEKSKL